MKTIFKIVVLLILFSFSESVAYTPPTDSAIANGEHPRLYFVDEGSQAALNDPTLTTQQQLQAKINANYSVEYQRFIKWADDHINDSYTTLTIEKWTYTLSNYAFIYKMGITGYTAQNTQAAYGNRAKAILLHFAQDAVTKIDAGSTFSDQHHGPYLGFYGGMGIGYDWLYDILAPAERSLVADAIVKAFGKTFDPTTCPYNNYDLSNREFFIGALAIMGDGIQDVVASAMLDNASTLIDGNLGIVNAANFIADSGGGWSEGFAYASYSIPTLMNILDAWRTATSEDHVTGSQLFTNVARWIAYHIEPYADDDAGKPDGKVWLLNRVNNTRIETSVDLLRKTLATVKAQNKRSDTNMAALNSWLSSKRFRPLSTSDAYLIGNYLFDYFIWGDKSVLAQTPAALSLPLTQQFTGLGQVVMRDGFEKTSNSMATFSAMSTFLRCSHSSIWQSSFTISKNGPLTFNSGSQAHYGYGTETIAANTFRFSDPLDTNTYYPDRGGQRTIFPKVWNDPAKGFAELTTNPKYDIGGIKKLSVKPGEYDYIYADSTRAYNGPLNSDYIDNTEKVAKFTREMIHFRPINSAIESDYYIVLDRVQTTRANIKKRWLLHMPYDPVLTDAAGATMAGTAGVAGHTFYDNPSLITMNNQFKSAQARMFVKTLLPQNIVIEKIGDTGHEFESYDGLNDLTDSAPYPVTDSVAFYAGRYRIEVLPAIDQVDDIFLHVFEATSGLPVKMADTVKFSSENNDMVGVHIKDAKKENILMASNHIDGTAPAFPINYTISTPKNTSRHLIVNLPASATYSYSAVKKDNGTTSLTISQGGSLVAASDGVIYFELPFTGVVDSVPPGKASSKSATFRFP